MLDFIYKRIANIKGLFRTLFPEPKAKPASDGELNSFLDRFANTESRSPKGKEKLIDGVGESSTSKESETKAKDKANERLIDKLYAQKKELQTNLDSAKEKTILAQGESTRLREE